MDWSIDLNHEPTTQSLKKLLFAYFFQYWYENFTQKNKNEAVWIV